MLPQGDQTSSDFRLPITGRIERIKQPLRRFAYPIYNALRHPLLAQQYATADFKPDLWLWGQRGNDYERHRRRVNSLMLIAGREILVAGCGTGQDVESWLGFRPRRLVGVDWFSYERAWRLWSERFAQLAPSVEIRFAQADLARMQELPGASFDVVSSDAVFEHVKNLPEVLGEFHRILRPGGILYATFGPLWYCWGGDHVSGYDGITSGYNHLLLDGDAYQRYLQGMGAHHHSEHDGRTWIEHDLFSRLTARQYLRCLEGAGFSRLFVSAMIEPKAVACLQHRQFGKSALEHLDQLDLLVTAMTIIYVRRTQ